MASPNPFFFASSTFFSLHRAFSTATTFSFASTRIPSTHWWLSDCTPRLSSLPQLGGSLGADSILKRYGLFGGYQSLKLIYLCVRLTARHIPFVVKFDSLRLTTLFFNPPPPHVIYVSFSPRRAPFSCFSRTPSFRSPRHISLIRYGVVKFG